MASTSRASPKRVENAEIFQVLKEKTQVQWYRPIFKKWWKFMLHFVLNVCLVNCFILYDVTNHPPSTAHGNRQLTFSRNLVRQLIDAFTFSQA